MNSVRVLNDNIFLYGCLFHYGQCIWRKIQNLGFANDYKNNLQIRNIFKLFLNLPYFKLDRLTEAYQYINTIITHANKQREFSLFLVYYERPFFLQHRPVINIPQRMSECIL
ncbi:hypothetical protein DMUE_4366 [Dictyocoela muelleri]|nr:hypothetical protein DMUE_4366 [Dictyocoela muelleri]